MKALPLTVLLFLHFVASAQLPQYLGLSNSKILNHCLTATDITYRSYPPIERGPYDPPIFRTEYKTIGRVWNTLTRDLILSVNYQTSLTLNSIYYSDSTKTYIHSNTDGHLITEIPEKKYLYNFYASILWKYSEGKFDAYSETGQFIKSLNVSASNIYPYSNEIRYSRTNSIYMYPFASANENLVGTFSGNFYKWFMDGEHFLTTQGNVVRVYNKNASLIKIIDLPSVENLGGNGHYFWIYPSHITQFSSLNIYSVNQSASYTYPLSTSGLVVPTPKSIAIFSTGISTFSIVELADNQPTLTEHKGSGPYLSNYNADPYGNWTTINNSGVINYGTLTTSPKKLNIGTIRSLFGNKDGHFAISTSSGHVITYQLNVDTLVPIDTFDITASKVMLSADGNLLAAGGPPSESQYSEDFSLYVFDVPGHSLVKKWNHGYTYNNLGYIESENLLTDFDFTLDGSKIAQQGFLYTNTQGPSNVNYLSSVYSQDSVFLNTEEKIRGLRLSPNGGLVFSSPKVPSKPQDLDIAKLYNNSGALINAFEGYSPGWVSNSKLFFNKKDSELVCMFGSCTPPNYKAQIISTDGTPDPNYKIPFTIDNLSALSEDEYYVNAKKVSFSTGESGSSGIINIKSGEVLFRLEKSGWWSSGYESLSASVGADYIVYIEDNALKIINWRNPTKTLWYKDGDGDKFGNPNNSILSYYKPEGFVVNHDDCDDANSLISPNTIWYKDADGDGYGDPYSNSIHYQCLQPEGYVLNYSDCDDSNNKINPGTVWYRDADLDGFGDPNVVVIQCDQIYGYVSNNQDCDDSNPELTPLNNCIITGVDDPNQILEIYPNPSNGVYNIRHRNNHIDFVITNSVGKIVNSNIVRGEEFYILDISNEPKGLYIILMSSGETVIHSKVIKQ